MTTTVFLPHDVAGSNTWDDEPFRLLNQAVPGLAAPDATADPDRVFYSLPPVRAIFGAAWREAVAAGCDATFADWLEDAVRADAAASTATHRWRYDLVVGAWASQAGADRVTVLLDRDDRQVLAALETALDVPEGTLALPETATPVVPPAFDPALVCDLSAQLVGRLEAVTAQLVDTVRGLGVHLVGDVESLRWRESVDVETAADLAIRILDGVAGQVAPAEVVTQLEAQRAELAARRTDLGRLRQRNRSTPVQSLESATTRAILLALVRRLQARVARPRGGRV